MLTDTHGWLPNGKSIWAEALLAVEWAPQHKQRQAQNEHHSFVKPVQTFEIGCFTSVTRHS